MRLYTTFKKFLFLFLFLPNITLAASSKTTFLNVSYDPTRELFDEYNELFLKNWKGEKLRIVGSNGGSGKQSRSVIDGLRADVVTLALSYDIDAIAKNGIMEKDWQYRLPHNSCAYNSTIVFLVHKHNPKKIHDWDDLIRPGVKVVTPNPKTSGGARWNYMAAWSYAIAKNNGNEKKAIKFMNRLFANVPILDIGARGSTTTFIKRGIGDVLITWENEAYLAIEKMGEDKFEIIAPPTSILTEPPIAVVDQVVDRKGTRKIAESYLRNFYSKEAQEIIAKHYFRPIDKKIMQKYRKKFPAIKMTKIDYFGGWEEVQNKHFSDGGLFDQIYNKK